MLTHCKHMKTHIALFLSAVLFIDNCKAAPLQESTISDIVSAAIPAYNLVEGDLNWSGGVKGNADMDNLLFDSNTAFLILELKPESQPLSALKIAERINEYIIQTFNFPTTSPSSTWLKKQPKGTTEETFGETFLRTYPQNNDLKTQAMYLTIQAIKLDALRYAVTLTYVNRER